MTIVGPTLPSSLPLLSPSRPTTLLAQLQSGQTLQASVERILAGGEVELRVGSSLIRVNTPVKLAPGQPLTLNVELTSQGPLLRANQQAQQLETIASAWRSAIPKQKPVAEVFTQLQQLIKQPISEQLPKPLHNAIKTFIQQVPRVDKLSQPDNLRRVLQQSGPQLEAKLLHASLNQQTPNTNHDLKVGFLRIAQQVLQWQSQQQGNPTKTNTALANTAPTNPAANTSSRTAGVELYHALLNSASNKPSTQGESLPATTRPLLPPLLPPDTSATTTPDKRLLGSLQQILERILPASFSAQIAFPAAQTAVTATNTSNVTTGQALLRIAAEILNQLESGLARIQHHQLTSMPGDEPVRTLLNVELPVLNNQQFENIGIRIEQEETQQQQQENKHNWRAVVSFDLPKLGKVQAIIGIQQQQVSTEFRSENKLATELFRTHIDLLQERLQEAGLKTGKFHFTTGAPMVDIDSPTSSDLLHTKA